MNENEGAGSPDVPPLQARVVSGSDLRPALGTFTAVAVLGLPLGWVWSRLAPPEVVRVAADGALVPLLGESEHRFDALALFVLLGFAAGVLAGVAVWMLRESRGPVVLLGAIAGSAVAGWLAMGLGEALPPGPTATWHWPQPRGAPSPGRRCSSRRGSCSPHRSRSR